jgi:ubiquinone/menaquinone biosynthesis C-methylase UbiE
MSSTSSADRFNSVAAAYRTSEVHRSSPALERLRSILPAVESVCDVGCGAGHAALSFAGSAARIVAVDPAPLMLEQVRQLAAERGVAVETVQAFAESIPLESASFDLVVSRLAAHHFAGLDCAFGEMVRLAKPGGRVAVIDLEGDEDPAVDRFNHEIEQLHDPTHVRSHPASRWKEQFLEAGLDIELCETRRREMPEGLTIRRWCEISQSGAAALQGIHERMTSAPPAILAALHIACGEDGEFRIPVRTLLLVGRKPA